MASEAPILASAVITEVLEDGRLFMAELPNGKRIPAHVPAKRGGIGGLSPGDAVTLEMTPFDFSKGRIRLPETDQEPTEPKQ